MALSRTHPEIKNKFRELFGVKETNDVSKLNKNAKNRYHVIRNMKANTLAPLFHEMIENLPICTSMISETILSSLSKSLCRHASDMKIADDVFTWQDSALIIEWSRLPKSSYLYYILITLFDGYGMAGTVHDSMNELIDLLLITDDGSVYEFTYEYYSGDDSSDSGYDSVVLTN